MCLSLPVCAAAESVSVVEVSGVIFPDFSRILFQTTMTESFQAKLVGDQLVITFPDPIQLDFHSMLKTLSAQVTSASQEQGGRKVVIRLKNADVHLRKLRGANFFGVDLLPQKKTEAKEPEPTPQPEIKKPEVKKVEKKKPAEEKSKTKAKKKGPEPLKTAKKVPVVPVIASGAEPEMRTILEQSDEGALSMPVEATKLMTLPWEKLVSAAIYVRGDALWMVFDHYTQVPLTQLPPKYITGAKQISDRQSTILKLTLSPTGIKNVNGLWATREQNSWVLYYGNPPPQKPILITTPEDTGANEIKLVVRHTSEPFNMLDPEIGDTLFVVPVRDPGNRVFPGRRFVEFEILPTLQGVVLLRRSDDPSYKVTREGVEITSKQRLLTSPVVKRPIEPEKDAATKFPHSKVAGEIMETPKGELEKKTMYPFAHMTDPVHFMPTYYKLLAELQAEPEATRSQVRLKMAEHFFLNQYYAEALGLLRDIMIDDPEFAATAGIKPMIAGSLFMMERYDQAAEAFSHIIENKEMPEYAQEQKLWNWVSSRMVQQQNLVVLKKEEFDVAPALDTYLASYPFPLRRKLLLAYQEQLLNDSRTGIARKVSKEIRSLDPTADETEMLVFFEARALLIDGKNEPGLQQMQDIMNNAQNPRIRTMALIECTRMARQAGKMTLPEAIAALEKGRIEWRGDAVEFALLKQLGQYYIDNKQYTEGLRVWRELVTQFPGTSESLKVASDMAKVFATLFDTGGAAYQLPPLQALSAFFEFNELTPVGVQGDRISRLLADYLTSVDLLENAAAILTHQVRFRSQGEDRAKLALKLVDLHLANDRTDLAEGVLNVIANDKMPTALQPQYHLLRAEILLHKGNYPEALKMLEKDTSPAAADLKLAVYWHQQQWELAANILESELKNRSQKMDTLTHGEEERVLRLAIAYSKLRRFDDLKVLKQNFGKRLKDPKIGDNFDFVTDSLTPIDHTALESSLQLNEIQSFLEKYRKQDRPVAPPSTPVPTPAAEEKGATAGEEKKAPTAKKEAKEKPTGTSAAEEKEAPKAKE